MLTRYDIILIAGLLLVAVVGLGIIRYGAGGTSEVVISVDGEETVRVPLSEDRRFSVDGPLGKTEIEIKDERVRVVDSPCKRKICVQSGWIDKPYQTIICVPNRVVINLQGSKDRHKLDGVTE
jgi:hypothetical protein